MVCVTIHLKDKHLLLAAAFAGAAVILGWRASKYFFPLTSSSIRTTRGLYDIAKASKENEDAVDDRFFEGQYEVLHEKAHCPFSHNVYMGPVSLEENDANPGEVHDSLVCSEKFDFGKENPQNPPEEIKEVLLSTLMSVEVPKEGVNVLYIEREAHSTYSSRNLGSLRLDGDVGCEDHHMAATSLNARDSNEAPLTESATINFPDTPKRQVAAISSPDKQGTSDGSTDEIHSVLSKPPVVMRPGALDTVQPVNLFCGIPSSTDLSKRLDQSSGGHERMYDISGMAAVSASAGTPQYAKRLRAYEVYLTDPKVSPHMKSQVVRAKSALQRFYEVLD